MCRDSSPAAWSPNQDFLEPRAPAEGVDGTPVPPEPLSALATILTAQIYGEPTPDFALLQIRYEGEVWEVAFYTQPTCGGNGKWLRELSYVVRHEEYIGAFPPDIVWTIALAKVEQMAGDRMKYEVPPSEKGLIGW